MNAHEDRRTPAPATYEGRVLPRPDEEVVDQGLAFDLATLFNRRRAMQLFGVGAMATAIAACGDGGGTSGSTASTSTSAAASSESSAATGDLVEIPEETAGPYPGDGSNGPDVLNQSGVVRRDIRTNVGSTTGAVPGVDMTLKLTLLDMAGGGNPMSGAAVYAWHCDRDGNYSMYSSGVENDTHLRGVQVSDDAGVVTFTSIFPACYSGRWPHIHFEVYPDQASITDTGSIIATSQVALPQNVCETVYATEGYSSSVANLSSLSLATDNVFGDDGGAHQVATVTGSVSDGYSVALAVPIDTTTAAGGGGAAPPAGPGGSPPAS